MEMNEYELLYLCRCHDEAALGCMQQRFIPFIVKTYNQLKSSWPTFEFEEAKQAGYLGLLNAIYYYREDRQIAFHNFALICMNRQILSYLRRFRRIAKVDYMSPLSIDRQLKDNEDCYLADAISSPTDPSPADSYGGKLVLERLYRCLEGSPMDKRIIAMRIQGYSYQEIAGTLHISAKSVDNAIQRIRKKVANLID